MYSKKAMLFNHTVSEAQLVKSLRKARDIAFPLSSFPVPFVEWLTALACSVNTKPEFVLIGAISVVSTLMGPKTKIKIKERYSEPCNLFTVCLSEPGAGKSQAFEISVETPLKDLTEPAKSMVVHDFTREGLFQHLVAHKGRALVAHSQMSAFYELILKKQQEGSGERQLFCRLYDGTAEWALTSATGGEGSEKRKKRVESSLALGGFPQPGPFMRLFKPLTKDGFLDRILVCSIKPHLLHEKEVEMWGEKLSEYTTQGFAEIYDKIYQMHEDGIEYKYSNDAKSFYVEYSDTLSDKMNAQWEEDSICTDNLSQDKTKLIRLSCVLHVLLGVVGQFIESDRSEDVPGVVTEEISLDTLHIAKDLIEFFAEQRKAFLMITTSQERTEK